MGDVELQSGNTPAAQKQFQAGYELAYSLADADPKDDGALRDLGLSYGRLGDVALRLGQTKAALDWYEKSLTVSQRRADADPKDAQTQRDLSVIYEKLGEMQLQLGQPHAALEWNQKSLTVAQRLAEADPKDAQAQTDLFISHYRLGSNHKALHNYEQAVECFANGRAVLLPWHEKGLLAGRFKDAVADIDCQIKSCQNAEKAIADIEFVFRQPAQIPALLALRVDALLKREKPADAVSTAERFAAWAEMQDEKSRDEQRYNAACSFALCAAVRTRAERSSCRTAHTLTA